MQKKAVSLALLAGVIAGCGGGGGGSTTGTAYYVDSPVEGITYTCGSQAGITDAKGAFIFEKGKDCTFFLGDIPLKSISKERLSDGATIKETNVDIARLLQSLDWDGNPLNGISIKSEIISGLKTNGFTTFPTKESDFEKLDTMLQQLQREKSGFRGTVVSEEEAQKHLEGNHLPVISATANPAIIYEGESVHFDASGSSDPDRGDQLSFLWKIGNTTLSQESTFTHTFSTPGTYTVTLTIADTQGGSVSKSFTIRVDEGQRDHTPPTITLNGDNPLEVIQNESVADPGITAIDDVDTPADITFRTIGHIASDQTVLTNEIGRFQIKYFATDQTGNEANITREVHVRYPTTRNYLEVIGDNTTGVIIDHDKHLTWTNGTAGCYAIHSHDDEQAKRAAQNFCSELNSSAYGGFTGWRVGTPEENSLFMIDAFGERITPFYTYGPCLRVMGIDAAGNIKIIKTHNTHDIGGFEVHTFSTASSSTLVAGVRCVTDQTTPNESNSTTDENNETE